MNEIIFLIEEALEGGYTGKAIGEGIFTEGDTLEGIKKILSKQLNVILKMVKSPN
jgi:hypothetical protein